MKSYELATIIHEFTYTNKENRWRNLDLTCKFLIDHHLHCNQMRKTVGRRIKDLSFLCVKVVVCKETGKQTIKNGTETRCRMYNKLIPKMLVVWY